MVKYYVIFLLKIRYKILQSADIIESKWAYTRSLAIKVFICLSFERHLQHLAAKGGYVGI